MDYLGIYQQLLERGRVRKKINGDHLHKHRVVPGFVGGEYMNGNISYLTRKEHRLVHKIRHRLYGSWQDKCAYLLLSHKADIDQILSIRGRENGIHARDNNKGIFGLTEYQLEMREATIRELNSKRWEDPEYREKMLETFCDSHSPEQRHKNGKLGGKIVGTMNAESGHCARIAHLGGATHKNSIYLTNVHTGKIIRVKEKNLLEYSTDEWITGAVQKTNKRVKVGDVTYNSQSEAARHHGIAAASVKDRINSKNFPDWSWA